MLSLWASASVALLLAVRAAGLHREMVRAGVNDRVDRARAGAAAAVCSLQRREARGLGPLDSRPSTAAPCIALSRGEEAHVRGEAWVRDSVHGRERIAMCAYGRRKGRLRGRLRAGGNCHGGAFGVGNSGARVREAAAAAQGVAVFDGPGGGGGVHLRRFRLERLWKRCRSVTERILID